MLKVSLTVLNFISTSLLIVNGFITKDCLEIKETKRKRPCSESTTVNAESLKCSRSQLGDLIKLEHVWVLDNWQSNMQLLDVTEFINSPVFFSDIDKSIRWQIQVRFGTNFVYFY